MLWEVVFKIEPYTYALVNSTKSFKDEKARVLNEVIQTGHEKEIVYQYLKERYYDYFDHLFNISGI